MEPANHHEETFPVPPESPAPPGAGPRGGGAARRIAALLFLALLLLEFPRRSYTDTVDPSGEAMFEFFPAKGYAYGREMFLNTGPYGFVHYPTRYVGFLTTQKILLANYTVLVGLGLILWCSGRFPPRWLGWVFLVGFGAFFPFRLWTPLSDPSDPGYSDLQDKFTYVTPLAAALFLLQPRRDRRFLLAALFVVFHLAFLSLHKHTLLVAAVAVAGGTALDKLLRGHVRTGLLVGSAFPAFLVFHWVVAGQAAGDLPGFLEGIFSFSGGYNEVVALYEPWSITILGLAVVLLLLGLAARAGWPPHRNAGSILIPSALLYLAWKHGFVRADAAHESIFFHSTLHLSLLCLLVPGREGLTAGPAGVRPGGGRGSLAGAWAGLLGVALSFAGLLAAGCAYNPLWVVSRVGENLRWITAFSTCRAEMERDLLRRRIEADLPVTRSVIGDSPVDFHGFRQGLALLNGFNFHSRPVPVPHGVTHPILLRKNEAFLRDDKTAPPFVIVQYGAFDGRFAPPEDALAFAALLDRYRLRLIEKGFLLWERSPPGPGPDPPAPAKEVRVRFGEAVWIPPRPDGRVWAEISVSYSPAGKLLSFLYKPPPCHIALLVEGEDQPRVRRFAPILGRSRFLISPLFEDGLDLLGFSRRGPQDPPPARVREFVLTRETRHRAFFRDEIEVRLHSAPYAGEEKREK